MEKQKPTSNSSAISCNNRRKTPFAVRQLAAQSMPPGTSPNTACRQAALRPAPPHKALPAGAARQLSTRSRRRKLSARGRPLQALRNARPYDRLASGPGDLAICHANRNTR